MSELILSWSPLVLGSILLVFIAMTIRKGTMTWGRKLVIVWIFGLFICLVAAYRDGYGFSDDSVLSFSGLPANLLSLLGISATLVSISAIIIKNQAYRRLVFQFVSVVLLVKMIAMEAIRLWA